MRIKVFQMPPTPPNSDTLALAPGTVVILRRRRYGKNILAGDIFGVVKASTHAAIVVTMRRDPTLCTVVPMRFALDEHSDLTVPTPIISIPSNYEIKWAITSRLYKPRKPSV